MSSLGRMWYRRSHLNAVEHCEFHQNQWSESHTLLGCIN